MTSSPFIALTTFDKSLDFERGRLNALAFCEANSHIISAPAHGIVRVDDISDYGRYGTELVQVNVRRCRPPSLSAYSWSWPGYTADLTPSGVVAHEMGHHVHFSWPEGTRNLTRTWRRELSRTGEPPVTSYGKTSTHEDIAESLKVFITNSDLLRVRFPLRHAFIRHVLTLRPIETRRWFEVISESERHVLATIKRISPDERRLALSLFTS